MCRNDLKCSACTKKCLARKGILYCSLCSKMYHPKCVNLLPSDVNQLITSNLLVHWTCYTCTHDIFPLLNDSIINDNKGANGVNKQDCNLARETCKTCNKLGNVQKMLACWICDSKNHVGCSAGDMGCKSCLRTIYPGYNVTPKQLHSIHGHNNVKFNPFSGDHESNYIGDSIDADDDFNPWDHCSNILNNCKYYEPSQLKHSKAYELKVYSLNIRSLNNAISNLRDDIEQLVKFDVLCFNETNCNVETLAFNGNELELEGFHAPFIQAPARASNRGGGLAIYINKKLCEFSDIQVKPDLSYREDAEIGEFQVIEISHKGHKNSVICNLYRSPNGKLSSFIDKLENTLSKLARHRNKNIFLLGDSNIDLLDYGRIDNVTKYVDLLGEHGFAPVISRPTRITNHSATIIDHIFINNCHAITKSGIITESLSDHLATFVGIILDSNRVSCKLQDDPLELLTRVINDENIAKFEEEISATDWNFLHSISTADAKFNAFEKKYEEIYNKHFPLKTKKPNRRKNVKPWILEWLQLACDRKNKLYCQFVKEPTSENEVTYKKMKKFVEKHIKLAKKKYYNAYFKKYAGNSKKQWQMINSLINKKRKGKVKINKIRYNGSDITNPQEIADSFNDYFCNIAEKIKAESGLSGGVGPAAHFLPQASRCAFDMELEDSSPSEVASIIKDLKNKSTSDMGIMPLKSVGNMLSPVISHVISSSLKEGSFPEKLKLAKVVPLHKGGSRIDVTNYRPISLLSCFSKIFEKVMQARLVKHLKTRNILYDSQYGFRAGHSCEHALLEAQNKIHRALEKKQVTALLLLDFSKAFDTVDSEILLHKLEHYGVRGLCLAWFKSYLTSRRQYVHVNDRDSAIMDLKYGVPQGSILGPILFIIYINDLPNISTLAHSIFFADDANLIISADTYAELNNLVNIVVNTILTWVANNGLKLNVDKTKYMIFTNKRREDIHVSIDGNRLKKSEHERFLGVIIDSKLNWTQHIKHLKTKISRNAGVMYKLKGIIPHAASKMLYNSLIQSHLYYCATVWGTGTLNSIKSLFSAQKKAVRAADNHFHNYRYNKETNEPPAHTKSIFNKLEILALPNLIAKSCLTIMHKIYLKAAPTQIVNIFETVKSDSNSNRRTPRRDPGIFVAPYNRLNNTDRSLSYIGPRLYNEIVKEVNKKLPPNVPCLQNKFMNPFKTNVNKHLLNNQKLEIDSVTWSNVNFTLYNL